MALWRIHRVDYRISFFGLVCEPGLGSCCPVLYGKVPEAAAKALINNGRDALLSERRQVPYVLSLRTAEAICIGACWEARALQTY